MKRVLWLICLLTMAVGQAAEIAVPWQEIRKLLEDRIRGELANTTGPDEVEPQRAVLSEAHCELTLGPGGGLATVTISGKVISGALSPIPLLQSETLVSEVGAVTGGTLHRAPVGTQPLSLIPSGRDAFSIALQVAYPLEEDARSRYVALDMPRALVATLKVTLPPDWRLLDAPGFRDDAGMYHLSVGVDTRVRFAVGGALPDARIMEVDTMSHVDLRGNTFLVETTFVPVQSLFGDVTITGPHDAQVLGTSLRRFWVRETEGARLVAALPQPVTDAFTVQYLLADPTQAAEIVLRLPTIAGNNGREGMFVVSPPPGAEVVTSGAGLMSDLPVASLGEHLQAAVAGKASYSQLPPGQDLTVRFRRLETVSKPSVVLDDLTLFASFEENGGRLSVLRISVPADAGRFLAVARVEQAEIWALTVNGRPERVYDGDDHASWVVPLASGQASQVELAFLSRDEKLGLHGRLVARVPRTGLSAKEIRVVLGLPARVELMSIEGPVSPAKTDPGKLPASFAGVPHIFTRSFYKGEAFDVALYYREPTK